MKTTIYRCAMSALICASSLIAQVKAQESMTTAQLLENAQSDNAHAAAMFIAGWTAGTTEQLKLHAEDLSAAGADSDRVGFISGLAMCVRNNIEVADLSSALRAALQDDTIGLAMPASTALHIVATQICVSRGLIR